jgi:ribose 5-phosphate isomerase B
MPPSCSARFEDAEMILLASDHGGLELKEAVKDFLREEGLEVSDLGTMNSDSVDYPDFGVKVAGAVSRGEAEEGILICGTGIGMAIVANKFPRVRAALVFDEFTARMAKEHNNANIIVMGGRVIAPDQVRRIVAAWKNAEFEGGRHQRRLDKIAQIEEEVRTGRI